MKTLLRAAIRAGLRRGWSRGVADGNRAWVVIGGLALMGHLIGRWLPRDTKVIFSEKLEPGDTFEIRHLPPS